MDNFNNNVFKQGHFESWNNNFGQNFTDNFSDIHKQRMMEKNIETGGAYQAQLSGAYGEFTVSTIFKSLPEEYHVMDNILLQKGVKLRRYEPTKYGKSPWKLVKRHGKVYEVVKKSTQIDHLIVSPYGIFVIETKNHKGYIFGDINSKVWTQVLSGENNNRAYGGHDHYTFYNPINQNQGHIDELSKQLKLSKDSMLGLIVFTSPDAYLGNVKYNNCLNVEGLYEALMFYRKPIWTKKQTIKVIQAIEKLNSSSYLLSKEHETYVKDIKNRQEINRMIKRNR